MATAQRVFWESVATLVFIALLVLAWLASGYRAGKRLETVEADHQRSFAEQAARHEEALTQMRLDLGRRTEAHHRDEAVAAFRGYAAGIQPAVSAGWRRYLNTTRDRLLAEPGFSFVHLVTPQGLILTSSDPDLVARGRIDEAADWARAATELVTRPGEKGTVEVAAPIRDDGRTVAHLWIGYDPAAVAEANGD